MFRQGSALLGLFAVSAAGPAIAADPVPTNSPPVQHDLTAVGIWHLNSPHRERFDASALLLRPNDELWTVSDRGPTVYRIERRPNTNEADLIVVPDIFTSAQLAPLLAQKHGHFDAEGLAQDDQGRVYLSEESDRWIVRFDPKTKSVERLNIDWTPVKQYFYALDPNASFEGVAFGGGRLYVANERQVGRIIVVDPANWRVVDNFSVRPMGSQAADIHYSDLSWFEDSLFVLLRENRCVLQVEPKSHRVLAEFSYSRAERNSEFAYQSLFPVMEGLAVDPDSFWLVTDNNGEPRRLDRRDTRPTLVQFKRPK